MQKPPEQIEDELRGLIRLNEASRKDVDAAAALIGTWTSTRANPAVMNDHDDGQMVAGRLVQLNARLAARELLQKLSQQGLGSTPH